MLCAKRRTATFDQTNKQAWFSIQGVNGQTYIGSIILETKLSLHSDEFRMNLENSGNLVASAFRQDQFYRTLADDVAKGICVV